MDNNGSGGVYAAEKIIRKRYKKVNLVLSIQLVSVSSEEFTKNSVSYAGRLFYHHEHYTIQVLNCFVLPNVEQIHFYA